MSTKTFAQHMGYYTHDWAAFLAQSTFTLGDLAEASRLADSWFTGPTSNLSPTIPRNAEGKPKDVFLQMKEFWFRQYMRRLVTSAQEGESFLFIKTLDSAKATLQGIYERADVVTAENNRQEGFLNRVFTRIFSRT